MDLSPDNRVKLSPSATPRTLSASPKQHQLIPSAAKPRQDPNLNPLSSPRPPRVDHPGLAGIPKVDHPSTALTRSPGLGRPGKGYPGDRLDARDWSRDGAREATEEKPGNDDDDGENPFTMNGGATRAILRSSITHINQHIFQPEIFPLESDAYGLLIMRLVHYYDEHDFSSYPLLSLVHAFILWALNFTLQVGITIALLALAEELENPWEEDHFQKTYGMSMEDATWKVQGAVNSGSPLGAHDIDAALLGKCKTAVGAPYSFYCMMIYLWIVRNFGEAEKCVFLLFRLLSVEKRIDKSQSILSEEKNMVIRLDKWMVYLLVIVVPLTRIMIASLITYAGMKFLILQTSELRIILKALCMQFVTNIDELLLSLATTRTKSALRSQRVMTTVADPGKHNSMWDAGLGGMTHLAIVGMIAWFMINVLFGGLVNFREACTQYHYEFTLEGAESRSLLMALSSENARRLLRDLGFSI